MNRSRTSACLDSFAVSPRRARMASRRLGSRSPGAGRERRRGRRARGRGWGAIRRRPRRWEANPRRGRGGPSASGSSRARRARRHATDRDRRPGSPRRARVSTASSRRRPPAPAPPTSRRRSPERRSSISSAESYRTRGRRCARGRVRDPLLGSNQRQLVLNDGAEPTRTTTRRTAAKSV